MSNQQKKSWWKRFGSWLRKKLEEEEPIAF